VLHYEVFGISLSEHRAKKHIKDKNLRDGLTTMESSLLFMAETSVIYYLESTCPQQWSSRYYYGTLVEVIRKAGYAVGEFRKQIERDTKRSIVSAAHPRRVKPIWPE
jgi:hypothetical protein